MVQQQLSKLSRCSRKGCSIASTKSNFPQKLFRRSSFFSSIPATDSSNQSPKFPIPRYNGRSQPIPKTSIIIPSSMPSHHQQKDRHHEIANALRPSYASQTPLLLQNMHANCDAIHFWKSFQYWRVAVGEDAPVEVEVGKSYNSGNRVTMRFGEYLEYLSLCMIDQEGTDDEQQNNAEQEVAYLAQNELFPQVLNDVPIPAFCESGEYGIGDGKLYHTMLWMGPRNTVSSLHFDPLDNILMQMVGWKRVLLFPPDSQSDSTAEGNNDEGKNRHDSNQATWWHYAGAKGNQYNTSAIDIENPDHDQFPNFKNSAPTPYECILGPGDGLYIPKKWWHHVRSLEMSVSANVWWR